MTQNELIVFSKNKELKGNKKFKTPEILLIDCEDKVIDKLKESGFNIEVGSFGKKYKIYDNNQKMKCISNGIVNNILEKDVIVVDMKQREIAEHTVTEYLYDLEDGTYFVSKENQNTFNPINITSLSYKEEFEKLKEKESVFIIFSDEKVSEKYLRTRIKNQRYSFDEVEISNYDFLPFHIFPNNIKTQKYEIMNNSIAQDVFKNYKGNIFSECKFQTLNDNQIELIKNLYNEVIGYLEFIKINDKIQNMVIVLPQCQNKETVLENILIEVLPKYYPDIFQDFTKDSWVDEEEYLLPKVKEILIEKQKIEKEYNEKILELEDKIKKEKEDNQFLYDIIKSTGTGDKLVKAIIKCLEYLEYYKIQDMDKVTLEGEREEDLHIYKDESEYFIAEVKGVNGPAIEDDCNVIVKYKSRNCAKLGIPIIHGVVFVNYHKNVEPNEREELGFTKKEIKDAKRDNYTLVGTYQLFKAIRLCQEEIVSKEAIKRSLETPGIFQAIPDTFEIIGKIDNLLTKKNIVCIPLECEELKIGDELLIIENNSYYKSKIISMQVDEKDTQLAKKNDKTGIQIDGKIPKSKSAQIYLIK